MAVENEGGSIAFEGPVDDADPMNKPPAKTNVERTPAGLQMVLPGCERRTLPKSTSRVDEGGQGLLHFFKPPSLREQLESAADTVAVEQGAKGDVEEWFVWLLNCPSQGFFPLKSRLLAPGGWSGIPTRRPVETTPDLFSAPPS